MIFDWQKFAWVLDKLKAERELDITIDIALRKSVKSNDDKSVRFNEIVQRQVYRQNSSILGQKKLKNVFRISLTPSVCQSSVASRLNCNENRQLAKKANM